MRLLAAAALISLIFLVAVPVWAQDETVVQPISDTAAAALLIQAGRLDEAKSLLTRTSQLNPEDNQVFFLLGLIAIAEEDYDAAIGHFRFILARTPEAERVRLELTRAFFLSGDYDNAARNFRFARAGDMPPEVRANIDQFLGAIIRLKEWSYSLSFALAQDSNVNAATELREVQIFGLHFVLSDDARKKSGYGLSVDAGGEWSPLLAQQWKAHLGANIHRTEYSGGAFDDMTIAVHAGPEFLLPRWQITALATGFQRWFGNAPYNNGVGGRVTAAFSLTPQIQLGASFDAQTISYQTGSAQNGVISSFGMRLTYTLSPSSIVLAAAGVGAREAKVPAFASTTHWLGAGYYRDLPRGFSIYLEPNFSTTRYHAPLVGFGATRKDYVWSIRSELLNRRLEYAGFTPKLTLSYTNQSSNIALYDFSRSQISVGLTRQF